MSEKKTRAPETAIVGWFSDPSQLVGCAKRLREAGYSKIDAHTPFPVHGLDKAMGIPPSVLPWFVLLAGGVGMLAAFALCYYTQAVSYPLRISGKAPFAVEAYVPIIFEVTVLFAALCAFFGLWAICGFPRVAHPTFGHPAFDRATDDAFFISVEAKDPRFDRVATKRLLEEAGASQVMEVS